jgi:hypothetical protein
MANDPFDIGRSPSRTNPPDSSRFQESKNGFSPVEIAGGAKSQENRLIGMLRGAFKLQLSKRRPLARLTANCGGIFITRRANGVVGPHAFAQCHLDLHSVKLSKQTISDDEQGRCSRRHTAHRDISASGTRTLCATLNPGPHGGEQCTANRTTASCFRWLDAESHFFPSQIRAAVLTYKLHSFVCAPTAPPNIDRCRHSTLNPSGF